MVTPAARREAVALFRDQFGVSELRACMMLGTSRMTVRYRPRRLDDLRLRDRMKALAHERRRFGQLTTADFHATFRPRRAPALRHLDSSAPPPVAQPAPQGQANRPLHSSLDKTWGKVTTRPPGKSRSTTRRGWHSAETRYWAARRKLSRAIVLGLWRPISNPVDASVGHGSLPTNS
jgi:hypothetical protein